MLRRLLARKDNFIGYLELAGVILSLCTFQEELSDQLWTAYVDNQGVLGAVLRGSAHAGDTNAIIGQLWLHIARLNVTMVLARVASACNIADEPTRGSLAWVESSGARWRAPILPQYLLEPWVTAYFASSELQ